MWPRRLRAGSRLERIGMVENLISEHNITDLADLMKVSDQLPPVLMREYPGPARPDGRVHAAGHVKQPALSGRRLPIRCRRSGRCSGTLLRQAVARREPGVNVLLYGPPGTGKTELAKVAAEEPRAWIFTRSNTPTVTATALTRAETATARLQISQVSS